MGAAVSYTRRQGCNDDTSNKGLILCMGQDEFECINVLTRRTSGNHVLVDDEHISLFIGKVTGDFKAGLHHIDISYSDGLESHEITLSITIQ